MAIMATY